MELEPTKTIRYERVVLSRLYKRSIKTNNVPIKNLCGERTCTLVDYDKEIKIQII